MATFDTLNSLADSLRPSVTPPGWKTRYQQASFRGVPFAVVRHETQLGQQTVVHEYPQRDTPWTEDMGASILSDAEKNMIQGIVYSRISPQFPVGRP